jgi:DNA polymerase-1
MKATIRDAYNLFHEAQIAFADIESNGIRVDEDFLEKSTNKIGKEIIQLEEELKGDEVFKIWQKEFKGGTNLGSLSQLAQVVFEIMKYPCTERTATGRPKADEAAFSKVKLPFVKKYNRLQKLKKAKNTYLTGIKREVVDGLLHTFFNLNTVASFRSSSDSPNFQNFPIRNAEFAELIRRCFIPRKGHRLVKIDYSGIEVKIAACYHKDPNMLAYIRDPSKDMHRDMAAQCYMLKPEQVSKQARYYGKNAFVFPQFYGDYYLNCSKALWEAVTKADLKIEGTDISLKDHLKEKGIRKLGACLQNERPISGTFESHIKDVEEDFWRRRFAVYKQWKENLWSKYQETGRITMLTGFPIKGLFRKNEAINLPIQGSAFHCLLWSMIQLWKYIRKNKLKTKIIGQIHDELDLDIPYEETQEVLTAAKRIMTKDLLEHWKWIIVPMEIEVEAGDKDWFEMKPWHEKDGVWIPKEKKVEVVLDVDVSRPESFKKKNG